jgi:hypothetical protein
MAQNDNQRVRKVRKKNVCFSHKNLRSFCSATLPHIITVSGRRKTPESLNYNACSRLHFAVLVFFFVSARISSAKKCCFLYIFCRFSSATLHCCRCCCCLALSPSDKINKIVPLYKLYTSCRTIELIRERKNMENTLNICHFLGMVVFYFIFALDAPSLSRQFSIWAC